MAIEGNKDEAEKCIDVAQIAFAAGNFEKAERFLLKAERLYPTARAKEILTRVRAAAAAAGPSKSSTPPGTPNAEEIRRRKNANHQPTQREYTQEQLEAVRRVKTKCKDYYEVLGKCSFSVDQKSRPFRLTVALNYDWCLQLVAYDCVMKDS